MAPSDPVAGPAEAAERVAVTASITATGVILAISGEVPIPTGVSIPVDATLMYNSVINIVPSRVYHNSKAKWDDVASHLREVQTDLTDQADKVAKEWEGPGAEAFDNYLRNKIIPTLDTLANAADQGGTTCEKVAGDVEGAAEFFLVSTVASIIASEAANALYAVPFAGPGLVTAAKWLVGGTWIAFSIIDIKMMIESLILQITQAQALEGEYNKLIELFGSESDRLDEESLERDRAEVEEVMEGTGGWNKP